MIGQTISHYKILEKLGEGGMGVVYKAQDTRLDRVVALKFLPPHLDSSGPEQARFVLEARAASALNHPNVCTIYDINEEEGRQFIAMEFVDGCTLKQKLPMQKPGDALTYALQIGDALHEAHEKGIVHRDIKSENIMVNAKNQIKVMDFGLAKLKGSLKITKSLSTIGTLAYMAPEQIQGGEVDARSDIFSFGVVLFEMLAGHMPFRGDHEPALMYSILNEEPESVQKSRPEISPEIDHIIHRALEKDPEDRYQRVDDMVSELRREQKKTTGVVRPSAGGQGGPTSKPVATDGVPAGQPARRSRKSAMWSFANTLPARVSSLPATPSPMLRTSLEREDQVGAFAELQACELAAGIATVSTFLPVDTQHLGVVGHSFGARAALLLAMQDRRVRAIVSLDGLGTATAIEPFRQAPSFRAEAPLPPLLHFYEELDAFMAPDFAFLHTLKFEELLLVQTEGMHHIHFTTYGFAASVFPSLAAATHATSMTSHGVKEVAEQGAAFLHRCLR